jgi:uncharacterized protein (TIGR02145 family)
MGANLNYQTGNSWCYDNNASNCNKYGRLYDWNTATKACPAGWRLPTNEEWGVLIDANGGQHGMAGPMLKSESWDGGAGDLRLAALPGGVRNHTVGSEDPSVGFQGLGTAGGWWTATGTGDVSSTAYYRMMGSGENNVLEDAGHKGFGLSVRCVQD